jgi:hypothetical protein
MKYGHMLLLAGTLLMAGCSEEGFNCRTDTAKTVSGGCGGENRNNPHPTGASFAPQDQ